MFPPENLFLSQPSPPLIFLNGEKSIDAGTCQESSSISGLCPNPPAAADE